MRMAMFLVKIGKRDHLVCKFICSGCGRPIDNLAEANFAPRRADSNYDDPIKLDRGLYQIKDEPEIWHWACDERDEAGVPWLNALAGLRAGMSPRQAQELVEEPGPG